MTQTVRLTVDYLRLSIPHCWAHLPWVSGQLCTPHLDTTPSLLLYYTGRPSRRYSHIDLGTIRSRCRPVSGLASRLPVPWIRRLKPVVSSHKHWSARLPLSGFIVACHESKGLCSSLIWLLWQLCIPVSDVSRSRCIASLVVLYDSCMLERERGHYISKASRYHHVVFQVEQSTRAYLVRLTDDLRIGCHVCQFKGFLFRDCFV